VVPASGAYHDDGGGWYLQNKNVVSMKDGKTRVYEDSDRSDECMNKYGLC